MGEHVPVCAGRKCHINISPGKGEVARWATDGTCVMLLQVAKVNSFFASGLEFPSPKKKAFTRVHFGFLWYQLPGFSFGYCF
jgi:hypothetical protein